MRQLDGPGRFARFCPAARKVHVDVDPSSINKLVRVNVPLVGDCATVLAQLSRALDACESTAANLAPWWAGVARWRAQDRLGSRTGRT